MTVALANYSNTMYGTAFVDESISAAGVIAKAGNVNVEAWAAQCAGDMNIAVLANAKVGALDISGHFANAEAGTNFQAKVATKVSNMTVYGLVAMSDADVTLDGDTDSRLTTGLEKVNTINGYDEMMIMGGVSAPVAGMKVGLDALMLDGDTEIKISGSYPMSKNFSVSAFYDMCDIDDSTRVEAKYTF